MGVKGNLSSVNLASVFQQLQRGNSTGLLRIQAPEGPRFVEMQNGIITIAGRSTERILLGDLLISRGLLDDNKLKQALALQKTTGKILGQVLIENRFLMLEHLEESLRFQIEEEVFELFTLRTGEFDFLDNAALDARMAPAGGLVRLQLDLNGLLQEASRRADEWTAIEKRIPRQTFLFQSTPAGDALLQGGDGVSQEGMILLRLVKTHRTVEAMVQKGCMGRFNTNRMLVELWDAGIIEPAPLAIYDKIALEHIGMNRHDEAQRLVEYVMEFGSPEEEKKAEAVITELEKERKPSSTNAVNVRADPKVRSEVIRRNQPNLMLKKQRSYAPLVLVASLVLIGVCGGLYYAFESVQSSEANKARAQFEETLAAVHAKIGEKKYAEALQLLNDFRTFDPDIQKLVNEQFERRMKDIEAMLVQAMDAFSQARKSGNADEIQSAIDSLQDFRGLTGMSPMLSSAYAEVRVEVDAIVDGQKIEELRRKAREIEASSADKGRDEMLAAYTALVAGNPPEAFAAVLRDILQRMTNEREDAERALKHARALKEAGDTDHARMHYQRVRQLWPGSELAGEADKELAKLEQAYSAALAQLEKLEALQNKAAEARAALPVFLQTNPPYPLAMRALTMLHGLSTEDESALNAALKSAQALHERAPAEARQRILQLVEKNPLSRTASLATLKLPVTSQPEGATITLNGRAAGTTPATLDIAALGMVRISLVKEGYRTQDFVQRNLREESVSLTLDRMHSSTRRSPVSPYRGMAVHAEHLLLVGAPPFDSPVSLDEITFCSRHDLRVANRIRWGTQPVKDAAAGQFPPFAVLNGELFIPTKDPHLLRANLLSGTYRQLKLQRPASSRPELFSGKDSGEANYIGVVAGIGFESFEFDKEKPFKKVKFLTDEAQVSVSAVFDGETFFISNSENAVNAIEAQSALKQWGATIDTDISGPVACHPPFSGTARKGIVAFAADSGAVIALSSTDGKEKWRKTIGDPAVFGVTSLNKGLLVVKKDKSAQLLAPQDGETIWRVPLPGQPVLPALAIIVGDPGKDIAIAVAVHDTENDQHSIVLLSAAGETIWRASLIAAPVALTATSDKLYVGLSNADILIYDIK